MYKRLDSILNFQPEKHPPKMLSDCFANEKSGVRSAAGLKILSIIVLKSFIILLVIGFILT